VCFSLVNSCEMGFFFQMVINNFFCRILWVIYWHHEFYMNEGLWTLQFSLGHQHNICYNRSFAKVSNHKIASKLGLLLSKHHISHNNLYCKYLLKVQHLVAKFVHIKDITTQGLWQGQPLFTYIMLECTWKLNIIYSLLVSNTKPILF
jgi:hypothetical protein